MKTRSHKNSRRRLTARERAVDVLCKVHAIGEPGTVEAVYRVDVAIVERAIQAAVRQALARKERRAVR